MSIAASAMWLCVLAYGADPTSVPGVTSLTNPSVKFTEPNEHFVELKRGSVTAVIVDNEAVDAAAIPKHKAGYNGLAVFRHEQMPANLFVPSYAGLNFEHIHDNPAWDFQWFVDDYKVNQSYGFVMRAALVPFKNREQLEATLRPHLEELAIRSKKPGS